MWRGEEGKKGIGAGETCFVLCAVCLYAGLYALYQLELRIRFSEMWQI